MDFSGVDMAQFKSRRIQGGVEYNVHYQVKVDMRSEDGLLRYSCIAGDKTVGITTIDFME